MKRIHLVLIGNKEDIQQKKAVSFESAKAKAKQLAIDDVFEVSAKTGFNVDDLFKDIVDDLPELQNKITPKVDIELEQPIDMDAAEKANSTGCCQIL